MIGMFYAAEHTLRRRNVTDSLDREIAIYHPLTSALPALPTGQPVTMPASGFEPAEYQGVRCMRFDGSEASSLFTIPYSAAPQVGYRFSVSLWVGASKPKTGTAKMLRIGSGTFTSTSGVWIEVVKNSNGVVARLLTSGANATPVTVSTDTGLHHVAMNVEVASAATSSTNTWTCDVWLDGGFLTRLSCPSMRRNEFTSAWVGMSSSATGGYSYLSALRVWERLLGDAEIAALAHEFTPTAS